MFTHCPYTFTNRCAVGRKFGNNNQIQPISTNMDLTSTMGDVKQNYLLVLRNDNYRKNINKLLPRYSIKKVNNLGNIEKLSGHLPADTPTHPCFQK